MKGYNNLIKFILIALITLCFISLADFKADAANVSNVSVSPNPFNPYPPDNQSTIISYNLTYSAILWLRIYDLSDNLVRDLVHPTDKTTTNKSSGSNSDVWNGRNDSAAIVPEATYPYHIDDIAWISFSFTAYYPYDIAVNPSDSNILWMTASDSKLYKSTDGGSNWSVVNYGGPGPAYGIAISSDGLKIYIIDDGGNDLWYSTDGGSNWSYYSLPWASMMGSYYPFDIACSSDGTTLYAVDNATNKVYKSTDSGANWNHGVQPSGVTGASSLTGVAVDPSNSNIVFVADMGADKVYKSTNGSSTFTTVINSAGTGDGQFNGPYQVSIDNNGYYWVSDQGNHRIQQFDSSNNWVMTIGGTGSGTGNYQFNSNNVRLGIFATPFSGQQYLYVADYYNKEIKRYAYENYISDPDIIVSSDKTPPAAITDFSATGTVGSDSVELTWTAPGDDGNIGQASSYDVRYAKSPITIDAEFSSATEATGEPAPSVQGTTENFTATGLESNTTYYFAIKSRDEALNTSGLSTTSPGGKTGLLYGWNMVSCPMDPVPQDAISVFFDDAGSNRMYYWYSTWTGVGDPNYAGYYGNESGQAFPYQAKIIDPGRGLFIWSEKTNDPTDATGTEISVSPYTLYLDAGWNFIGNPYGTVVNLDDCNVVYNTEEDTYVYAAMVYGWIGNGIYIWNGNTYDFFHFLEPPAAKLEPWKGYWIFAYYDLELIINKP